MKKMELKTNIDFKQIQEKFSQLNPKEIYAWPLVAQFIVGFLLLVAVLVAGTLVHLVGVQDELTQHQNKEEVLKKEFLDKKKQAINLDLYKKQLDEITKASDVLLKQLPNKSEIAKLLVDINQAVVSRGLQVELFKPEQEKMFDFYAELPIKIKVSGSYEAIGNFTADVGKLSRVVIFSDIDLKATSNGNLVLESVAKTFRYLDQEEILRQKAEKEKAKKDAARKPGAAPAKPAGK